MCAGGRKKKRTGDLSVFLLVLGARGRDCTAPLSPSRAAPRGPTRALLRSRGRVGPARRSGSGRGRSRGQEIGGPGDAKPPRDAKTTRLGTSGGDSEARLLPQSPV